MSQNSSAYMFNEGGIYAFLFFKTNNPVSNLLFCV